MSFIIVGHRGACEHAPENSLESYALAERIGVPEIELDVRLSADNQLFLLHDATLDRVAGDDSARGLGPAGELTLAQLQSVTLDSGRGVVTLAEMYDATKADIQLEIKDPATVPYLARYFAEHPDAAARTILTSFHANALHEAAELMPQMGRCIIVSAFPKAEEFEGGWRALLEYTGSSRFASGFEGLTPEIVREINALGIAVHVWPIRTIEDLRRGIEIGAEGGTTDDPALVYEWLGQLESKTVGV
jgi:glycerophosphoryl diester phosphodiesterase